MIYRDGYIDKYQVLNGFEAEVNTVEGPKRAYISMKPTTRAAYDLSMRENTVDGLITMDKIEKLKAGYTYRLKEDPKSLYFIQTLSLWETQINTINFNAIRCNCKVTIQRKLYNEETMQDEWTDIYKDVEASISETLQESKNFNSGFEVCTIKTVQMPMIELKSEKGKRTESIRKVFENDKAIVKSDLDDSLMCEIAIESVDNFGINGTLKFQGTQEMR